MQIGHRDRRLAAALARPCASRHKVFLTKTAPTRAPNRIGLEISGHPSLNNLHPVSGGMLIELRQSPVFRIELRHRLGIVYEPASDYVLNVRSATNIDEGVRRQYEETCGFTGLRPCL